VITVCIFAKPPVAGLVKTRLARAIGDQPAAELAAAFLADTFKSVQRLPWARTVVASTGALPETLVPGVSVWSQGEGSLDERIERVLCRALQETPAAIAIGADSPGMPLELLDQAEQALSRGEPVLGPAEDGGFYLLGVRAFPPGLLAGVPWSRSETCEQTVRRMTAWGMSPTMLPGWFDVDEVDDLQRLRAWLAGHPERAPRTFAALERLT